MLEVGMVKNCYGQPGHRTLKLTYLKNEQMEQTDFLHVVTKLGKLKVDSMIFGWMWSKMAVTFLVHETLKSVVS